MLLREKSKLGRISIPRFYARRVRRILPAATLVILATVAASYHWLGFIAGNQVAEDGKWAAAFVANIHFALLETDYFGQQLPPSPLQHMWSLGVEEQFYVVAGPIPGDGVARSWAAASRRALSVILRDRRGRLAGLVNGPDPDRRGMGILLPVNPGMGACAWRTAGVWAPVITRIGSDWLWQTLAAVGLIGIVTSMFMLDSSMEFPGYVVALPVVSSGLLIFAGCGNPATRVGRALAIRPMQWIGARSYSLYLWHWPPLVIAGEYLGEPPQRTTGQRTAGGGTDGDGPDVPVYREPSPKVSVPRRANRTDAGLRDHSHRRHCYGCPVVHRHPLRHLGFVRQPVAGGVLEART